VDEPVFLSLDQAEQVERIVQEGLLNISRHAQATRATVYLEHNGDELTIIIEDDGQGFDPAHLPADGRDHFGLKVMRARSVRLGGQIQIESQPGQGSRITLTWPYHPISAEITPTQLQPTASESSVMTPI
jgi:two-component system nitrate/nitrite sensor histidine kinase NarX